MRFEYGILWVGRVPEAFHARFLVSVRSLYGDSPPREGGKNSAEWTKQRLLHSIQDNKTQITVPQLPSSWLTVAYLATKAAGWFISREQELLLDYFKGISREPLILTGIFAQENDWIYQWRTIRASHLRSLTFWKILALYKVSLICEDEHQLLESRGLNSSRVMHTWKILRHQLNKSIPNTRLFVI